MKNSDAINNEIRILKRQIQLHEENIETAKKNLQSTLQGAPSDIVAFGRQIINDIEKNINAIQVKTDKVETLEWIVSDED